MRKFIAQGIYFEPAEDDTFDPVMGTNKGSIGFGDTFYLRRSQIAVSYTHLTLPTSDLV